MRNKIMHAESSPPPKKKKILIVTTSEIAEWNKGLFKNEITGVGGEGTQN